MTIPANIIDKSIIKPGDIITAEIHEQYEGGGPTGRTYTITGEVTVQRGERFLKIGGYSLNSENLYVTKRAPAKHLEDMVGDLEEECEQLRQDYNTSAAELRRLELGILEALGDEWLASYGHEALIQKVEDLRNAKLSAETALEAYEGFEVGLQKVFDDLIGVYKRCQAAWDQGPADDYDKGVARGWYNARQVLREKFEGLGVEVAE